MNTTDAQVSAGNQWRVARLKQKTPKERDEINAKVGVEQRLAVVDERHRYAESDALPRIQLKLSETSQAYAQLSSLAFFWGSPVGAELNEAGEVEYKQTSRGLTSWRIDESFKGKQMAAVLMAILDGVLGMDDEEMLAKIRDHVIAMRSASDPVTKETIRFFEKLFRFREVNRTRRRDAEKLAVLNQLKRFSEEERISILSALQGGSDGPIAAGQEDGAMKAA